MAHDNNYTKQGAIINTLSNIQTSISNYSADKQRHARVHTILIVPMNCNMTKRQTHGTHHTSTFTRNTKCSYFRLVQPVGSEVRAKVVHWRLHRLCP